MQRALLFVAGVVAASALVAFRSSVAAGSIGEIHKIVSVHAMRTQVLGELVKAKVVTAEEVEELANFLLLSSSEEQEAFATSFTAWLDGMSGDGWSLVAFDAAHQLYIFKRSRD